MASSPPSLSRGGGPVVLETPDANASASLLRYCPFVGPSIRSSALRLWHSDSSELWSVFRDLTHAVDSFQSLRAQLPLRERGLACLVVSFENETVDMRLPKLFSVVRPCVADAQVTMGLIPAGTVVRTGHALKAAPDSCTLVIFRSTHTRDAKFGSSPQYQAARASAKGGPAQFFAHDSPWPADSDRDQWLSALGRVTSILKGES